MVTNWGDIGGETSIKEMPVWIKLTNVPDCYWTAEGLGMLASVVGRPLCADTLTS